MVDSDWGEALLGDVLMLQRGFDLPTRNRQDGTIPVVSSSGITDKHSQAMVSGPGVVTGRYGTIGQVFFINEDFWPLNTTLYVRDFKGSDPLFITFLLRTLDFGSYSGKSGVPGVNRNDLHQIEVKLPPLPEQHAIAAALSDVDALITSLDRLIVKKRAIKQGAMQQLLTRKTRLPGFSGEWEIRKLGDVATTCAGGTPSTRIASYWGGDIRWMSSGELHGKRICDVEGRISEEGLKNSSARLLPSGCVLIGLAGQGKTRATVAMNMVELCTNQSIAAVLPSSELMSDYLYFNLDSRYDELRNISTGAGGRAGLNLGILNGLRLPVPPQEEQHAIATVLSDMDAEVATLERRRDKTRALKQGMMQELLTGRIRLT